MESEYFNKDHVRPFGWGAVIGVIATLGVLFATDWMVTESAATDVARASANQAMVDSLAPICVTQFRADPAGGKLLGELKQVAGWKAVPVRSGSEMVDDARRRQSFGFRRREGMRASNSGRKPVTHGRRRGR